VRPGFVWEHNHKNQFHSMAEFEGECMLNNKSFARPLLLTAIVGAALGTVASAAHAAAALEEVIVTAQKTEETIQSVPISIQALDAKTLENNAVNNFSDIKALVPSLKFSPYPTAQESLLVTIRGIPPGALELTQDTPAAVHINGVYIARGNGLNLSIADLERVEILRGPQGTLYGRNATAGAINLITAKPTDTFAFKQQITVAEYDQLVSKTSIDLPITDTLYTKLSYLYDTKRGFIKNSAPGGIDFGDKTAQAARFDLRWEPNADLTVDYGFDWSNQRYYSTPGQCLERGSPAATLGALMDPEQCGKSFKDKLAYYGHAPKNTTTVQGHTLNVEWDLGGATLRSITGYRQLFDNYYGILFAGGAGITGGTVDFYSAGLSIPAQPNHTKQDQFSQEFQLLGDIGDTVSYSTGLYYFDENGSETKGFGTALVLNLAPGISSLSMNGPRDVEVTNKSAAVFGQLKWTPKFLDGKLDIIPGLRYTRDQRKASMFERRGGTYTQVPGAVIVSNGGIAYTGYPDAGVFPFTGTPARFDKDFSKTTPSLTVQYHINEDVMAYAKYVEGYKSGGTAVRASNSLAFEQGFDPETLESYELGVKSSWLEQRLRVNLDVFVRKFKDQQVTVRNQEVAATGAADVPFDIVNAGRSTYKGAELELQAAVTENLRLSANYAYLKFDYDQVKDPATGADVTDFYHNIVPTNSYSLNADYTVGNLGFGTLAFNLSYSYTDRQSGPYQDSYAVTGGVPTLNAKADSRQFVTPSYGIWNGRAALSDIKVGPNDKGSITVALWAKNLTNKEYINYEFVTVAQAAAYQGFWGEPRTVGLDLIYRYE
jgi:iron complex outermembrane receptor protein